MAQIRWHLVGNEAAVAYRDHGRLKGSEPLGFISVADSAYLQPLMVAAQRILDREVEVPRCKTCGDPLPIGNMELCDFCARQERDLDADWLQEERDQGVFPESAAMTGEEFGFTEEDEIAWRAYLSHFKEHVYPMFAEQGVSYDTALTVWFVNRLRNAIPDDDVGNEPWQQ